MSQVGISRPSTQGMGRMPGLPEIQHPLSRLGNPEKLDIRGVSRAGSRIDVGRLPSSGSQSGRPLAAEPMIGSARPYRLSTAGRSSKMNKDSPQNAVPGIETIPEGIEVTVGDPNKPKIPIFGK